MDHVPPKCIFPEPRSNDLITVPACEACNMKRSGLDEEFKVFLGITVGYHLDGDQSYRKPVLRTLAHNRRIRSNIRSSMQRITVQDLSGKIRQSALVVPLNKEAHDTVVERTVRGLYFHETGTILDARYTPVIQWHLILDDELFSMTKDWAVGTVANPALVYKYAVCADDPTETVWVLQFFQKTWSTVIFAPDEGYIEEG